MWVISYLVLPRILVWLVFVDIGLCDATSESTNTSYTPPPIWYEEDIPNPQTDVWKCGNNGRKSWVCDPNNILNSTQGKSRVYKCVIFEDPCDLSPSPRADLGGGGRGSPPPFLWVATSACGGFGGPPRRTFRHMKYSRSDSRHILSS